MNTIKIKNRETQKHIDDFYGKCLPTSLNWGGLMALVEKIEGMDEVDEFTIKYCDVFGNSVQILPAYESSFKPIFFTGGYEKIELVFFACIEFIKWYNKNK